MIGPHNHAAALRVRVVLDTKAPNHTRAQPICECGWSASPWPEPGREVRAIRPAVSHDIGYAPHTWTIGAPSGTPHTKPRHARSQSPFMTKDRDVQTRKKP